MTEEQFLQELKEVADIFRRMVKLKDRKHAMTRRVYRNCFVGSQAVDRMVQAGWADTRREAVELGRIFQTHLGLFHHVSESPSPPSSLMSNSKKHSKQLMKFKDKNIFYRFSPRDDEDDDAAINSSGSATSTSRKKTRGKRSSWKRMLSWKQRPIIVEEEEE
mmetsp:Transcript_23138/g.40695  ORF Transcript_23138/g.40695 Transcript_23138/m.40695 type:complete len:162 (-) Transcript_23138:213-698(-)